MFSTNHFIWIAISALIIITLSILSIKLRFSFKTSAFILFFISVANELIKIMTNIIKYGDGYIIDPKAIPLHLCSIMIFVYIAFPFMKEGKFKEILKSFSAVIGLIGPLFALLIPTEGVSFTSITIYQYFIYHSAMIYFSIYLIFTSQVNLKLKSYLANLIIIFSLSIIMIWVNSVLSIYETNFFFIVQPPMENLPILNLNHGWHAYYFTLVAIGAFTITTAHLPSLIKQALDYRKIKKYK